MKYLNKKYRVPTGATGNLIYTNFFPRLRLFCMKISLSFLKMQAMSLPNFIKCDHAA